MFRKTKTLIKIAAIITACMLSFSQLASADCPACTSNSSQFVNDTQCGAHNVTGSNCNNQGVGFEQLIRTIVNIISILIGAIAIIMILISGFSYITSGGDTNKVESAKSTLLYAVIGLIVAALAQVIVHFALSTAYSSSTTCIKYDKKGQCIQRS